MSNLLIKPNNDSKIKFDITPETAHWDYVGFKLYHLKKGDNINDKTNLEESILVFVSEPVGHMFACCYHMCRLVIFQVMQLRAPPFSCAHLRDRPAYVASSDARLRVSDS